MSYEEDLAAVKQNGLELEYVKEQTPEICLAAVKQYGLALQYVKKQTPEICLAAVKQNGLAFKYVKEQTEEIINEAIIKYGGVLEYIKDVKLRHVKLMVKNNRDSFIPADKYRDLIIELLDKLDDFEYRISKLEGLKNEHNT